MSKVKLGDIAQEVRETTKDASGLRSVGLEHLTPGALELTSWSDDAENTFTKVFRKGQILFGRRRAYLKKAAVAPFDGVCSGDITVIAAKADRILPELLPFVISDDRFFDFAMEKSAGSLSPRVKWAQLAEYQLELPPMEEQPRVTKLLWAMERTKKAYQGLLAQTDELVKSQFIEMFGEPYSNSYGLPVFKVGELCDVTKLAGYEYTNYIHYQDVGDVVMIKGLNVKEKHLKLDDLSYIDAKTSDLLPRSQLHPGDVVMTYIGINLGDVAIVDDRHRYHLAPNVAKICVKDKSILVPEFLVNQIYYSRDKFTRNAGNTAKAVLNMEKIRKIEIILPDIESQIRYIEFVEQTDKSKLAIRQSLESLEKSRNALMNQIFG